MAVVLTSRRRTRPQQKVASSKTVTWHPSQKQYIDPDTTFLLDPDGDAAAGLIVGAGALINAKDSAAPSIVAGRYRKGVQPTTASFGYLWIPCDGVLGPGTYEFQLLGSADWAAMSNQGMTLGNVATGDYVQFVINAGQLTVTVANSQNPASIGSYSFSASSSAFSSGTFPAGSWVSVAATLTKAGTLTVYVNETQVAQQTGVAPTVIGSTVKQDGLAIPGRAGSQAPLTWTISDLRISRTPRTPGTPVAVTSGNSVVIANTLTGATVQKLNGMVKPLTGSALGSGIKQLPLPAAAAIQGSQKGVSVVRDDKFIQATPILASGTPDATHPMVGHSGSFCYDWQVVDRAMNHIVNVLGCEPYISLDNVPSILGGTHGPYTNTQFTTSASAQQPDVSGTITFTSATTGIGSDGNPKMFAYGGNIYTFTGTGTNTLTGVALASGTAGLSIPGGSTVNVGPLTCGYTYNAPENAGPPNNNASFATICADLAYHILNENNSVSGASLGLSTIYMGLWNEPDQAGEWTGITQVADYEATYASVAPALKAISANIKVGGPEISAWAGGANTTWAQALVNYCAAHSLPLDFISWHFYTGNLGELVLASLQVQAWAQAAGIATPSIIVGEWGYAQRATNFSPNVGFYPWCQPGGQNNSNNTPPIPQTGRSDYAINDYCAAFHAAAMILMTNAPGAPYIRATHYTGDDASLFDSNAVPQALYNVFRMWATILGLSLLTVTVTADPGFFAIAAKDGSGNVYVFMANLHYRKTHTGPNAYPVSVDVSAFGRADGSPVTARVVDDQHSNAYDTQGASTMLQTVTVSSVLGGKATINLRPRAVALLVI